MEKIYHDISITGDQARVSTLHSPNKNPTVLDFGNAGNYGIHVLRIKPDEAWRSLTVTAAFEVNGQCYEALAHDMEIPVPGVVTAQAVCAGNLVIVGTDATPEAEGRNISSSLRFIVSPSGGCTEGGEPPLDEDKWAEYMGRVDELAKDVSAGVAAVEKSRQEVEQNLAETVTAKEESRASAEQAQGAADAVAVSSGEAAKAASDAGASAEAAGAAGLEAKSWAVGGTGTREGEDTNNAEYFAKKAEESAKRAAESAIDPSVLNAPKHTTMIVTAMTEGIGFKADYTAQEIKRHADGGGVVILRFNAPDGSGEQSYPYETYRDGKAIFRRPTVNRNTVTRINILIDDRRNVQKEEEIYVGATADDIQQLEDSKANYAYKVIAKDSVSQTDALEVLSDMGFYDGRLIEFLTNGENPSKAVATGRIFTSASGDSFLNVYNKDGTTTVWNRDGFEKHNFECRSLINEPITDMDTLTIDVAGEAPYMASVRAAKNKPGESGDKGIVRILAYDLQTQIQIYLDIESGREWFRTVNGLPDQHSFGVWTEKK